MQYPPGYGQPGMAPGYAGMYAPPPPGLFGTSMQAMGIGQTDPAQVAAAQQGGASLFGSTMGGALGSAPGAAVGAMTLGSMVASFALAGLRPEGYANMSLGRSLMGTTPIMGSRALGIGARGFFSAANVLDPTNYMFKTGGAGMRMGSMLGRGLGGFLGRGTLGAIAGGGLGAVTGAAIPLAAAGALYKGAEYMGQNLYQGAQRNSYGSALMAQIGGSVAPGQDMSTQASATGRMMDEMSSSLGVGMEDIGRYAKQLDSQKVFQTTRSAKEFRTKFKEVMGAVKEIAKVTQGSVDDAMKMFSDLRQQGFYTTADVKAQAASRQARESTTGISSGVYSAIGGVGAQTARAFGMRGRFGARMAEGNVAAVATGVRSGAISEEEVMEMGGSEAVGMRLAQKQMSFLGSARGRSMIAYSMGKGGAPDQDRLMRLMGGRSIEDIVTGAAGRGLGVMRASGGREAKENFSEYAGMAMIQMAMAQEKQIYGRNTRKGTLGMLQTMGLSAEEAEIQLQTELGRGQRMREERAAKTTAQTAAAYADEYASSGIRARMGRYMNTMDYVGGETLRAAGSSFAGGLSQGYSDFMKNITGGRTYTGGDEEGGREYLRNLRKSGKSLAMGGGMDIGMRAGFGMDGAIGMEAGSLLGIKTAGAKIAEQYSEYTMDDMQVTKRYGDKEGVEKAIKSGELKRLDSGVYIRSRDLESAEVSARKGQQQGLSETEMNELKYSVGSGDYRTRLSESYEKAMGSRADQLKHQVASGGRSTSELEEEFGVFFAASESGAFGGSFEDYLKLSKNERTEMKGKIQSGMNIAAEEVGGDEKAKLKASVGTPADTGLGTLKDLQSGRDTFESQMDMYLHGAGIAGGSDGTIMGGLAYATGIGSGGKKALNTELSENGTARRAFKEFMQLVSDPYIDHDSDIGKKKRAKLTAAREKLRGILSDEAFGAVQELAQNARDNPGFRNTLQEQWKEGGTLSNMFDRRAAIELEEEERGRLKTQMQGMDLSGVQDPELKKKLTDLRELADTDARGQAVEDVLYQAISSVDESGQMISGEERDYLSEASGGRAGILDIAASIRKGDLQTADAEFLKERGVDVEGLRNFKGTPEEQAKAIADALKEAGMLDFLVDEDGVGGEKKEGVETEYVKENARFVQLVHHFASAVTSKIDGIETIPGPGILADK